MVNASPVKPILSHLCNQEKLHFCNAKKLPPCYKNCNASLHQCRNVKSQTLLPIITSPFNESSKKPEVTAKKHNNEEQSLMNLDLPEGLEKLDRVTEGYQVYQTLLVALDLGLFDLLDEKGPQDSKKIAQDIGINGMFSRCFLDALVDTGFLSKKDGKYTNTNIASDFLLNDSPFYQGEWLRNTAHGNQWNNLEASLKRQQPEMTTFNAGPTDSFIRSIAELAVRGELQAVTKNVSNWNGFKRARMLLDLGGGHGLYAIALCQINPKLKGVIFDKPHVTSTTRQYITRYHMQKHLSTLHGDISTDRFGSGYDIVIISHLLYKFRKDLEPIFSKVYDCLNPGGLLVTNHWFCGEECRPESSGIKELDKSLHSFGHPLCHVEDFYKLFEKMGFRILATSDVPSSRGNSKLQLAVKEQNRKENTEHSSCACK